MKPSQVKKIGGLGTAISLSAAYFSSASLANASFDENAATLKFGAPSLEISSVHSSSKPSLQAAIIDLEPFDRFFLLWIGASLAYMGLSLYIVERHRAQAERQRNERYERYKKEEREEIEAENLKLEKLKEARRPALLSSIQKHEAKLARDVERALGKGTAPLAKGFFPWMHSYSVREECWSKGAERFSWQVVDFDKYWNEVIELMPRGPWEENPEQRQSCFISNRYINQYAVANILEAEEAISRDLKISKTYLKLITASALASLIGRENSIAIPDRQLKICPLEREVAYEMNTDRIVHQERYMTDRLRSDGTVVTESYGVHFPSYFRIGFRSESIAYRFFIYGPEYPSYGTPAAFMQQIGLGTLGIREYQAPFFKRDTPENWDAPVHYLKIHKESEPTVRDEESNEKRKHAFLDALENYYSGIKSIACGELYLRHSNSSDGKNNCKYVAQTKPS